MLSKFIYKGGFKPYVKLARNCITLNSCKERTFVSEEPKRTICATYVLQRYTTESMNGHSHFPECWESSFVTTSNPHISGREQSLYIRRIVNFVYYPIQSLMFIK